MSPLIYYLKCQKNLSITLPKPSFRPRPTQTERSGPHALLAVQTEPRPHTLVKANDALCPQTWGMRDRSARCLPLSMFTLWKLKTVEDSWSVACCFFCIDAMNSAGAEIGHVANACN